MACRIVECGPLNSREGIRRQSHVQTSESSELGGDLDSP